MLDRMMYRMYKAYWDAQLRLMEIKNGDEEDGMETLETIILVAVAVVIAGTVIAVLGREKEGLIGSIMDEIENQITNLFGKDSVGE